MDGKVIISLKDYENLKKYEKRAFKYIKIFSEISQEINESEKEIIDKIGAVLEDWYS